MFYDAWVMNLRGIAHAYEEGRCVLKAEKETSTKPVVRLVTSIAESALGPMEALSHTTMRVGQFGTYMTFSAVPGATRLIQRHESVVRVGSGVFVAKHSAETGLRCYINDPNDMPTAGDYVDVLIGMRALTMEFGSHSLVSQWGQESLCTSGWVLKGATNYPTYFFTRKWQRGLGNIYAPYPGGKPYHVPNNELEWPSGWERWKGLLGQRRYTGPPLKTRAD